MKLMTVEEIQKEIDKLKEDLREAKRKEKKKGKEDKFMFIKDIGWVMKVPFSPTEPVFVLQLINSSLGGTKISSSATSLNDFAGCIAPSLYKKMMGAEDCENVDVVVIEHYMSFNPINEKKFGKVFWTNKQDAQKAKETVIQMVNDILSKEDKRVLDLWLNH